MKLPQYIAHTVKKVSMEPGGNAPFNHAVQSHLDEKAVTPAL